MTVAAAVRERRREREDVLFRQHLLAEGLVSEDLLKKAVRERARLASRGTELTLYQVLLKMRLVDLDVVKRIVGRIHDEYSFCEGCGIENRVDGVSDLACRGCGRTVDPGRTQLLTPPPGMKRAGRPSPSQRIAGDRLVGTLAGKCRLEERVGEGGMGLVYRARHLALDKVVAVKVLNTGNPDWGDRVKRFLREAQTMARIKHPNVLTIHDVVAEDGLYAIVMEYCEGQDLGRILARDGKLAPRQALEYTIQACRGLSALHEAGIIHRDLKPDNLMVDPDGSIRVMDFSLAREMEQSRDLTLSDEILGTPYYMSPEQCTGRRLDPRSDIYSLGATLYQLLTGQRPFGGDSAVDIIMRHLFEEPIPPHRIDKTIPVKVSRVVLKMLSKSPENRYAGCAALEQDLVRVARGQSPLGVPWLSEGGRRRARRAAAALAVALAVGAGVFAIARDPSRADDVPAQHPVKPPPPVRSMEDEARTASQAPFDFHDSYKDIPENWALALEMLRRIPENYPGTAAAVEARDRMDDVVARREAAARRWWDENRPMVQAALDADRFDAARVLLRSYPDPLLPAAVTADWKRLLVSIDDLETAYRDALAAERQRVLEAAGRAEAIGDLARAVGILDGTAERFAVDLAAETGPAREALVQKADAEAGVLEDRIPGKIEAGDFDSARTDLAALERVAIGPREESLRDLRASLARAETADREARRRREALESLARSRATLAGYLREGRFDAAESLLLELSESPVSAALPDEVASLAAGAARYRKVVDAVPRAIAARKGRSEETAVASRREGRPTEVSGRVVEAGAETFVLEVGSRIASRKEEIAYRDLTIATVVELAAASLGEGRDARLDLVAYLLFQEAYDDAGRILDGLTDGGDLAPYRRALGDRKFDVALEASRRAFEAKRWSEAWRRLEDALALRPDHAAALEWREAIGPELEKRLVRVGGRFYKREPKFDLAAPSGIGNQDWQTVPPGVELRVLEGGGLSIAVPELPDGKVAALSRPEFEFEDLRLEVSFAFEGNPPSSLGVFLRQTYTFHVWRRGWEVTQQSGAGSLESGDLPPPESPLTLVVVAAGDRLVFHVDGREVGSVEDATLARGRFGIVLGGGARVRLETFRVDRLILEKE